MRNTMFLALAMVACTNSQPGPIEDTGFVPVDTGTDDQYFPAANIYLGAEFGFDGTRLLTADVEGNASPPLVLVTLATDEWDNTAADIENYCLIGVPLYQSTPLQIDWTTRLWFGQVWQAELDPVLTTCNTPGYELNPARWGSDPVGQLTDGVGYFVAVGDMTKQVATAVNTQAPDLDLIGGALGVPDFLQGGSEPTASAQLPSGPHRVDHVYSFAYAMDEAGRLEVVNGALVEIPSKDLRADPLRPVFYSMTSLFFWRVP